MVITFSGVFLGVLIGIALKPLDLDNMSISYIAYPGELFMRLLKLMILPLIIASLITGMIIFDLTASYIGKIFDRGLRYETSSWSR